MNYTKRFNHISHLPKRLDFLSFRGGLVWLFIICSLPVFATDGHGLWLPNKVVNQTKVSAPRKSSPTLRLAVDELKKYATIPSVTLQRETSLKSQLGADGFIITPQTDAVVIKAASDVALLYGVYELLRRQQLGESTQNAAAPIVSVPTFPLRMLNHWDNLDGTIERGYAGESIFWNDQLHIDTLLIQQYARANASIGINATVLNNVNASPRILTKEYLQLVRTIANLLRPYGIRVYLSINFASPMALGETTTADPLDKNVARWWKKKAREIYRLIPDFGGFLVKANSEGQPGPGDYKRSHAEGANMLADALNPHSGIVVWRCFVYGANHKGEDRVKQAVSEFKPLDGQFRDNVILQTKNGPLDFQPREPYSPVFDQITKTPNMAELQITQEYLGQSRHLVFLAPLWEEFFTFVEPNKLQGVAGVANIGLDANWCGHHFSQANWYAFGRLAWNPRLKSGAIAKEWLQLTFPGVDREFISSMSDVMLSSREACVDYMMPLGLHHIFKFDHHYGPEPDGFKAEYPLEWCPVYYHQADSLGVGFDRSSRGTNAVGQYREPYASIYDDPSTCPENLLLWFHHLPWDYTMKSGQTLWQELVNHYNHGVSQVEGYVKVWQQMKPYLLKADGDLQRWNEVDERMTHQLENAREWRDVCLGYFGKFATNKVTIQSNRVTR
ncbi:MAG: alpha-glucuronidase [Prevotella sp.]|nr:alpha-glucuronidase [Prevotella sp.]